MLSKGIILAPALPLLKDGALKKNKIYRQMETYMLNENGNLDVKEMLKSKRKGHFLIRL